MNMSPKQTEVDAFIENCVPRVATLLEQIRQAVKAVVPDATETINYGIPTLQINGKNMLHYGPGKNHVGLYATPDGHKEFDTELNRYKRGKGSVQFPLDEALPIDLIQRIAVYRAQQLKKEMNNA